MTESLTETRLKIGSHIQDIMTRRGISQVKLAASAGISREQLRWLLKGQRDITLATLIKVLGALERKIEIV